MTAVFYLLLAAFLAVSINHGNSLVRGLGTAVAALSLLMMVTSIFLADFDGTFAHMPAQHGLLDALKPSILNLQAIVGAVGIVFLAWAASRQFRRIRVLPLPLLNSAATFGCVSRYVHWITAVLILALIPMGLFISTLPASDANRADFVAAHQSVGLFVLMLVAGRLAWLVLSPPAALQAGLKSWERQMARAAHGALYLLILTFPLTGLLMTLCRGDALQIFDRPVLIFSGPHPQWSPALTLVHDQVLPLAFYGIFWAHLGAVLKHHFLDRRIDDVRRMLR